MHLERPQDSRAIGLLLAVLLNGIIPWGTMHRDMDRTWARPGGRMAVGPVPLASVRALRRLRCNWGGQVLHAQLNVAIVSQNEIEREGLRRILTEQAFSVIGVHRDPAELDLDPYYGTPDDIPLVIVDSSTEDDGLETCRVIHARWPDCKIVFMSADCQSQMVAEAFHAGIDGYVGKHISCASLTEMLKLVALGEKMIPSQVVFDLASLKSDKSMGELRVSTGDANLSDREVEILRGLIRGEPNKVISRRLTVTEATVKVHVKSILRKLGVMNRTQAAIWGMSRGLTEMTPALATPIAASDGDVGKRPSAEAFEGGRAYMA